MRSRLYSIPDDASGFSIKIVPEPNSCNCLRCRSYEWDNISNEISSYGVIARTCENEGFFDLVYEDGNLILETHESGPEIIVLVTASLGLITAITNLIITIIKNLDSGRNGNHYYIKLYKYRKDELQEELLVKIDSNSAEAKKIIREILEIKLRR